MPSNAHAVTVIVPVLDDEIGLANCLRGLHAQTYPAERIAIVVVDNGSTPPLDSGRAGYAGVTVIRCERPGSYAARNDGVSAAAGDILAFTDADCVPEPDWLTQGVTALLGDEECIVGGEVLYFDTEVQSGTSLYQQAMGFGQQGNIEVRGFTATANLFCTRRQFGTIGPFDERLYSGGDREWCWRARRNSIPLRFEQRAVVRTRPRVRLTDAVRQARRVAAGRAQLGRRNASNQQGLRRERNLGRSILWVLSLEHLSFVQRLRVLWAGGVIRLAAAIETIRLRFGGAAERR